MAPVILRLLLLPLLLLGASCSAPRKPEASSSSTGVATLPQAKGRFNPAKLQEMDRAIEEQIAAKKAPGAVLWLEREGTVYQKAYGQRALDPQPEPISLDTIYDAASLTKVVATTPAVLLLVERGKIFLDSPVKEYLPHFQGAGKDAITVRQLLTHTSGLRPGIPGNPPWFGYEKGLDLAYAEKTSNAPETSFRYSDINFIVLGEIVRQVSGRPLNEFVAEEIYRPLKMTDTGYLPSTSKRSRIAPTEQSEAGMLRGVVHDPTARKMGGVAGHAGLFTTAADLARYARMLLNQGILEGQRIFKPETVRLMTSVHTTEPILARRGLGWDIDSGYSRPRGTIFPLGSYGHTGWTGTALWIDPFSRTFWIFLSNRVHPDGKGNILPLQLQLGTLAAQAVEGFDFTQVVGALPARRSNQMAAAAPGFRTVKNGIDVLVAKKFAQLKGKKVGLITNHTGADRDRNPTIDLLLAAPEVELKALFSPEHGIRGQLDEKVGDSADEKTGLPVYSLYGDRRSPTADQLKGLDTLVFDIQDIGCRFYTYISTLGLCLGAASSNGLQFVVLDRINPITGTGLEGPIHLGKSSFTAFHPLPVRHGLTIGELARMFNAERGWKADLKVIELEGWRRELWMDQTGLPWSNPSPNMRSLTAATLYPGVGLLETALAVGRGTATPFEIVGAPYIDERKFAEEMNKAGLEGVGFIPARFTPTASTFKDKPCAGVMLVVHDRNRMLSVDIGITMALVLQRLYPGEFALDKVQTLLQDQGTINAIRQNRPLNEIKETWRKGLEEFAKRRQEFLIY